MCENKQDKEQNLPERTKIEISLDGRVTLAETAKFLGYTCKSFAVHHTKPGMPPYIKIKGKVYFYYNDLLDWVKSHPKKYP